MQIEYVIKNLIRFSPNTETILEPIKSYVDILIQMFFPLPWSRFITSEKSEQYANTLITRFKRSIKSMNFRKFNSLQGPISFYLFSKEPLFLTPQILPFVSCIHDVHFQ